MIVLQKGDAQSKCAFVYLKKKLTEVTIREALGIPITVRLLEEGEKFEDESIFVTWKDQSEISGNWQDLGHLVVFNTHAGEKLSKFYQDAISKGSERLTKLGNSKPPIFILRGLEPSVENLLNLIFVVRPIDKGRVGRSKLILTSEEVERIRGVMKDFGTSFEIPRASVRRGLKTASYVPRLDVEALSDLAILKPFDGLQDVQRKLGIREFDFKSIARRANDRLTHLLVS